MQIKNIFVLCLLACIITCQNDGNPHNWSRKRRCDEGEYNPPCGLCEGVGGVAWGDKESEIKITSCEPVASAEELTKKDREDYPTFPNRFIHTDFYQILINQKTNFTCVGGGPGTNSIGDHCYNEYKGLHYYDWGNHSLLFDSLIDYKFFKINSKAYHVDKNMFIVMNLFNKLKFCICLDPGKEYGIELYPIQPDFMKEDSRLIGREKLFIEYINKEVIVDHWIKGPHHIWKDVETGKMIRAWQPYNGLQIFSREGWSDFTDDDQSKIIMKVPPQTCVSGWFRFGCDKKGYPKKSELELF